jgi:hypothetical protein
MKPNIKELKKLCDAAAKNPWHENYDSLGEQNDAIDAWENADMDFVSAARTAMPLLIARIEELEEELKFAAWPLEEI